MISDGEISLNFFIVLFSVLWGFLNNWTFYIFGSLDFKLPSKKDLNFFMSSLYIHTFFETYLSSIYTDSRD